MCRTAHKNHTLRLNIFLVWGAGFFWVVFSPSPLLLFRLVLAMWLPGVRLTGCGRYTAPSSIVAVRDSHLLAASQRRTSYNRRIPRSGTYFLSHVIPRPGWCVRLCVYT